MKRSGKNTVKAGKSPGRAKKPRATAEESALREKTETLAALTDALTAFLEQGSFSAAFGHLLGYALERTESEYGFVGVIVDGPKLCVLAHEGMVWDAQVNREFYENAVRAYESTGYLEFKSFDNLFGKVYTTGQVVVSNDPARDPRSSGIPAGHPPLNAFLGVPIRSGGEVVGMFGVANRAGGYSGAEQRQIETLVRQAAVLCDSYLRREREASLTAERERAREEAQLHVDRLRAIHDIDLAITSSLDLDRVLSVLLEKIDLFFPYETASTVRLFDPESQRLSDTACRNLDEEDWRTQPVFTVKGRGMQIFESKRPVVIRNLQTAARTGGRPFYTRNRLVSYLGVPLKTQDTVLGILSVYTREEREFTADEIESLLTLASQGAIAINNARLHREAQERAEEQLALAAVAQATSQSLSLADMLDLAMDAVLRMTKRQKGYIRLKDPATGRINLAVQKGISEEYIRILLHERSAGGRTEQVFDTGEPLVINDSGLAHPKEAVLREQVACVVWVPIHLRFQAAPVPAARGRSPQGDRKRHRDRGGEQPAVREDERAG
jgi:GAF domain-containing protein